MKIQDVNNRAVVIDPDGICYRVVGIDNTIGTLKHRGPHVILDPVGTSAKPKQEHKHVSASEFEGYRLG
jgi:hypothetical protein